CGLFQETALAGVKYGPDVHMVREDSIKDHIGCVGNDEPAESGLVDLCPHTWELTHHQGSVLDAGDGLLHRFGAQVGEVVCDPLLQFNRQFQAGRVVHDVPFSYYPAILTCVASKVRVSSCSELRTAGGGLKVRCSAGLATHAKRG